MSLARALTRRAKRSVVDLSDSTPARKGTVREKISGPVQLVSTTNMLAYNAPDIRSLSSSSAESPTRTSDDSGSASSRHTSQGSHGYASTADTAISSPENSPTSPEPNHLSTYFQVPSRSATVSGTRKVYHDNGDDIPVPAIPQRALSHTKKSSQDLRHRPSRTRMTPPPTAIPSSASRTSHDQHPFSHELAQVNEVAEGFGITSSMIDEEEQLLMRKGLFKFGVEDYLIEIEGLYGGVFEDRLIPMGGVAAWI